MTDNRKRLRATPPSQVKGSPIVRAVLSKDEYRKLYDMAAVKGTSIAETLRNLIDMAEDAR